MEKNLLFIDAESDGLYGPFISVAMILTDFHGNELKRYYWGIDREKLQAEDAWVRENVIPKMGDYEACEDEAGLLEKVWEVWEENRDTAYALADVGVPVEARLFERCVARDPEDRKMKAPFPMLDLSGILWAKGFDPLIDKHVLLGEEENPTGQHNALYDIEQTVKAYRRVMGPDSGK